MVTKEIGISAPQETLTSRQCNLTHRWHFQQNGQNGNPDFELKKAIFHMVINEHEIDGETYGGLEIDNTIDKKLSGAWFQKVGLLQPLTIKFRGNIKAMVDYAFPNRNIENGELGNCEHHWRIETPNGPTSAGLCSQCGEVREFRNSSDDHLWENDSTQRFDFKVA